VRANETARGMRGRVPNVPAGISYGEKRSTPPVGYPSG
jgi:hypothetical protein